MSHVLIIGAGAYGTALKSCILLNPSHNVTLLTRDDCQSFQGDITVYDFILIAVPSQSLRLILQWIKIHYDRQAHQQKKINIISTAKGIEKKSILLPHQIIHEVFSNETDSQKCLINSNISLAVLSGPSFAKEMMQFLPTCVVLASKDKELLQNVSAVLHAPHFRVYSSNDVLGVEICGALKNVVAMVAGAVDGLNLGNNARAAVITRGLSEIAEIGVKMGANPMTFMGLSGVGDLILTCTGDLSRNRQFGFRLALGEDINAIIKSLGGVVEGVATTESAYELSIKLKIKTSLIMTAYKVLYENLPISSALKSLLGGRQSSEFDWTGNHNEYSS